METKLDKKKPTSREQRTPITLKPQRFRLVDTYKYTVGRWNRNKNKSKIATLKFS